LAVFRVEKKKDYTCMSNHSLRNHNLSLKAKGLHALMLSLPEDWDYTLVGLKHICRESIGSINGAIQELEKEGYIIRTRARNEKGQLTAIEYSIYEVPPETTENKASEPNVEKPHVENPHMEKPHVENRSQVNTNKQNTNRPSTKGQRDAYLLTSRAREMEQAIDELRSFIEERIGRPLWHSEIRICTSWVKNNADMDMIHLAVEDNLFRKDNFDLKYVQKTLDEWKSSGIDTPLKARNHILDSHVSNISMMAAEIAERNHSDDLREKILMGNEMTDLQGTRDYMIELYQQKRYDMLLSVAHTTYHKDILDYLPDEVREFILKYSV